MARVLKVFVDGAQQRELVRDLEARGIAVRRRYGAFLLVEATDTVADELDDRYLVDDLTDRFIDDPGDDEPLPPGPHHHMVHFDGPIEEQWLADVVDAGGTPRAPYADFAFVVCADEAAVGRIAALDHVRWVRHLPYADRISPVALERAEAPAGPAAAGPPAAQPAGRVFNVEFFAHEDAKLAREEVAGLGFEIVDMVPSEDVERESRAGRGILVVRADPEQGDLADRLHNLSAVHGVQQIWPAFGARISNDVAVRYMGTELTTGLEGQDRLGLDGAGECVAICDSGLDTGDPRTGREATIHPDFRGRIVDIKSYGTAPWAASTFGVAAGTDDGSADKVTGHGTHVAGSVLGDGRESDGPAGIGPIRGLAYRATLVFQAVEQSQEADPAILAGIPSDFECLLRDAHNLGAGVHTNAWAEEGAPPAVYTLRCEDIDNFVWEHKEFCVVVAAGNEGRVAYDRSGRISSRAGTVLPPATAKNCIAVGCCESLRPNAATYQDVFGQRFPPSIADRSMAEDPDRLAPFSGRGPTLPGYGGRYKPDLVAPGTFVLSTRSSVLPEPKVDFPFPGNDRYCYMSGTSQAAALVAGAATLVRQHLRAYLRARGSNREPTAALVKATLIAGARRLPGVGADTAVVDNDQGYGRVDLDAVLAPPEPARTEYLDHPQPMQAQAVPFRLPVVVRSSQVPLRVVMAYSDYPSKSPPPLSLINNLNLALTAPSGEARWYRGNQPTDRRGQLDGKNNVEVVHVVDPPPGTWLVEVLASNVPQGPQDFALVVRGDVDPIT